MSTMRAAHLAHHLSEIRLIADPVARAIHEPYTGVTMLFGNPADFAIEAGIEPDLAPPSAVWGHLRVWCGGVPLGNIDDRYCALYPAFVSLRWLVENIDELWDEQLDGLADRDVWTLLDAHLYGYHGEVKIEDKRTSDEMLRDTTRYEKFNFLTNWGEMFDGYKTFLLSPPDKPLRILCREFPEKVELGIDVSQIGFMEASTAFVQWFEMQQRKLNDMAG